MRTAWEAVLFPLALVGVVLAAYRPLLDHDGGWGLAQEWDDRNNFLENDLVRRPLSRETLRGMWSARRINVFEPLGWLLKARARAAWGRGVSGSVQRRARAGGRPAADGAPRRGLGPPDGRRVVPPRRDVGVSRGQRRHARRTASLVVARRPGARARAGSGRSAARSCAPPALAATRGRETLARSSLRRGGPRTRRTRRSSRGRPRSRTRRRRCSCSWRSGATSQ